VAEFESSPETAALARLAQLHRRERAPEEFRERVAQQLAGLPTSVPLAQAGAHQRTSRQRLAWIALLAMTAAITVWVLERERSVVPMREVSTRPARALPVSFNGIALPGSLRWRHFAAPNNEGTIACEYDFALRPEGSQTELRVRWTVCEFPASLREVTGRGRSSATDVEVHVFVSGTWSESGELQATALRVLAP